MNDLERGKDKYGSKQNGQYSGLFEEYLRSHESKEGYLEPQNIKPWLKQKGYSGLEAEKIIRSWDKELNYP